MRLTRDELATEIERVAEGDVAAFIKVYHATSRKLFGIVVRILGREDIASEVLQEVYLRVWERAGDYRAAQSSPITWLATIARNRALDEGRRRPMTSLDDVPELLEMPSEEDIIGLHLQSEELRRLRDCLARLQPELRQIFELVYFEGLTRDDAAARVGQSVSALKTWLRRGLAQLKSCLEP